MDVFKAIETRRSIRKYEDRPVAPGLVERLLEAARIAPSSSNVQSWKFKVVTDPQARRALKDAAGGQKFVEEAPVVIACCLDFNAFGERGKRTLELVTRGAVKPNLGMMLRYARSGRDKEFAPERVLLNGAINVSIAAEHIVLAAQALGLGTCWVRAFDEERVERLLDIPPGLKVLVLLTVGYPDQEPAARPRKSLDEITL